MTTVPLPTFVPQDSWYALTTGNVNPSVADTVPNASYLLPRQTPLGLVDGLVGPLEEALAPFRDRIQVAFVYGSIAKGTDTAQSDIDLMVISDDLARCQGFRWRFPTARCPGLPRSPRLGGRRAPAAG